VKNILHVVGIGPGNQQAMTLGARKALAEAEIIVGYTKYIELVKPLEPDKTYVSTGMSGEKERVRSALELAEKEDVCLICSGDAGVYGMSGLVYEMSEEFPSAAIDVIPGVTAALSGSALLGAPLGHDFCVISLSDLLTPWELIAKRLDLASQADFCISLYNPSSNGRGDHLKKASEIMLKSKAPSTVCGAAKNIGRMGESSRIMTLAELKSYEADMFSTLFIGNSQTKIINGKIITPRGYIF